MRLLKKYKWFLLFLTTTIILLLLNKNIGEKSFKNVFYCLKEMLLIIPPIFILMGLLDVWIPRETMIKYMGENSGIKGVILSFLIGSAAAGPLYAAFPFAAMFVRKDVKLTNVIIFLGAWSTTKIPMLLFEISSLGLTFAISRLLIDILGIIIISFALKKLLTEKEIKKIKNNMKEKQL